MIVRRAITEDLEAIATLLREALLPHSDLLETPIVLFVAEDAVKGKICGAIGLEPYGTDGLLRSLAVESGCRNRGLARTLTQALEEHAITIGIERLYLLTTTADDYFRRQGWADIDRGQVPPAVRTSGQFVDICPASAHCLVRGLASLETDPATDTLPP
ncbi:MAG: arsenic resistance N-acetyltransferase ArsN2 [Thermoanaerobaculia bacterium]|nr:arsenic resistance N-acetyltransferase ArsN2 [Thermoanaerobaculia bacterium]